MGMMNIDHRFLRQFQPAYHHCFLWSSIFLFTKLSVSFTPFLYRIRKYFLSRYYITEHLTLIKVKHGVFLQSPCHSKNRVFLFFVSIPGELASGIFTTELGFAQSSYLLNSFFIRNHSLMPRGFHDGRRNLEKGLSWVIRLFAMGERIMGIFEWIMMWGV